MSNELVQLVVQLYEKNWGVKDYGLARAVVAMCMEEAAKVLAAGDEGHDWSPEGAAAAIRALAQKETT